MRPTDFSRIAGPTALLGLLTLAACGAEMPAEPASGRALYERTVGGLACADCHGVAGRAPHADWRLPGPPLAGVTERESLWGGRLEGDAALADAVRLCAARFQYRMLEDILPEGGGPPALDRVPLTGDEAERIAAYASEHAPTFDDVSLARVDDLDDVLDRAGDPERGEEIWLASCAVCHGTEAEGGLGPSLRGNDVVDPFTLADYVRQGAPDVAPYAWMPHFPPGILSAQDLADLCARYAD